MAETTVVNPPQHKEVENFSDAERSEWLKTGAMPLLEEKVSSSEADASAASTPASKEAGGKEPGSGPGKKARSSDENWRALEAERNTEREKREAAERELEEFRTGKRKAEEKQVETAPKLLEMPKRPSMGQFRDAAGTLDFEKYEAALDKYETDKDAYSNQQVQLRTATQQQDQAIKTWQGELKTKYGAKADGIDVKKTVDALATTMQSAPAFFMFLNDSEVFTDLVYVLGTDPKLNELLAEAKDPKTMTRAIRKLVLLEDGVKAELGKPIKEVPKLEKKLTTAGKPPIEAGGGSSTPQDDGSSDAAWQRKDLSVEARGELYRERKNAEERAKRKRKAN